MKGKRTTAVHFKVVLYFFKSKTMDQISFDPRSLTSKRHFPFRSPSIIETNDWWWYDRKGAYRSHAVDNSKKRKGPRLFLWRWESVNFSLLWQACDHQKSHANVTAHDWGFLGIILKSWKEKRPLKSQLEYTVILFSLSTRAHRRLPHLPGHNFLSGRWQLPAWTAGKEMWCASHSFKGKFDPAWAQKSLRRSCWTELTCQGIMLP